MNPDDIAQFLRVKYGIICNPEIRSNPHPFGFRFYVWTLPEYDSKLAISSLQNAVAEYNEKLNK